MPSVGKEDLRTQMLCQLASVTAVKFLTCPDQALAGFEQLWRN
jgi:hypothetical protein